MSYTDAPTSARSLEQRIRNIEGNEGIALRRRVGMALVVVGQMLPEGAINGGGAMALLSTWNAVHPGPRRGAGPAARAIPQRLRGCLRPGGSFHRGRARRAQPVPVMRADHQVAQKLHAVPEEDSERARDLVDLQLLENGEDLDLVRGRMTCVRLFEYRRQQHWPATVAVREGWDTLYEAAVEDVDVLPDVETAAAWVNAFITHRGGRGVTAGVAARSPSCCGPGCSAGPRSSSSRSPSGWWPPPGARTAPCSAVSPRRLARA